MFDDSWLEDKQALRSADAGLRRLAEAGARLRREIGEAEEPLLQIGQLDRPRAVIAAGSEARFIRAMLEPVCPVPFVAWPAYGLPGWVGALDLVVVMASESSSPALVATVHEAVRRGAQLLIACPPASTIADHAGSSSTILLPTATADPLAAAIVSLAALHRMQLGPEVDPWRVADAMDQVATDCSPYTDVAENPAKDLATGLAEAQPLVWGGSVLASRASRRVAEALRAASGRAALAADADELIPVLESAAPRDPFADPFEDAVSADRRPGPGDPGRRQPGVADPHRRGPAEGHRRTQRHPGLRHPARQRLRRRAVRGAAADRHVHLGLPGRGLGRYLAS